MNILRFSDLCAQGKAQGQRVFIRADLNVPQDDAGNITEDTRIRASVPAIQMAMKAGAAVMVTSHLGRPTEGEFKPEDSLAPVAARLAERPPAAREPRQREVDVREVGEQQPRDHRVRAEPPLRVAGLDQRRQRIGPQLAEAVAWRGFERHQRRHRGGPGVDAQVLCTRLAGEVQRNGRQFQCAHGLR